jgi:hypothetical protein
MAWTTPKTWASEPLTSTDLNTYVRDNFSYLKDRVDGTAKQYIRTATDYTTTSGTLTDIDATNLALTFTTDGSDVMVIFAGYGDVSGGSGRTMRLALDIDSGTTVKEILRVENAAAAQKMNMSFAYVLTGLTAGSHTIKLQWLVSAGTGTLTAGTLLFDVREMLGLIA